MLDRTVILCFILLLLSTGCRKSVYHIEHTETVTDLGGGTGTVTWTNDKDYLISGFVFVNDGQILTIEPGTVIRAKAGQGSMASALIVARGGKIIAEGTNTEPIIFTAEGDDLEGSVPLEARGLWGGLMILGNAPVNTEEGEDMIEGLPVSEPRAIYSGIDEDDNSGILRYISIRHGGTNIGEGNEINGLTLGGVGRQTIVEYIEVISNEDDGVEIFGGTVNCKNLVVALGGAIGDTFDIDKLRYHKIIIATDADVDGAHITTLLLTLFYRYFKPVIDGGYLYIAQSPLFKAVCGKEAHYLYSEEEKTELVGDYEEKEENNNDDENTESSNDSVELKKDSQGKKWRIQRYKGLGEMNASELKETTMDKNNRILKQVTVEDAIEADKIFDMLMGTDVAARKSYITNNAKEADLDI